MAEEGANSKAVLFIKSDTFGRGPEDLSKELMDDFLVALTYAERRPWRIIFINTGVLLAVEGSPVYDALEVLEAKGVEMLVGVKCVEELGLKDRKIIGKIVGMSEIIATLMEADSVICTD